VGGLRRASLKGSEGTGSKKTSNEKKTARVFIVGRTFKTDQSETIDFGRFKTTIHPVATTMASPLTVRVEWPGKAERAQA
jgi:hypothetical protein